MAETKSTAMQPFKALLDKDAFKKTLAGVAAEYISPERLVRVALAAVSRTPALLKCTPLSIAGALMESAEMGLEAGGGLGHGYMVPFRNSQTGQFEAKFIPGYRGLVYLALRKTKNHDPIALSIDAWLVHENDGLSRRICTDHDEYDFEPCGLGEDPGAFIGAIARAVLPGGGPPKWIAMTAKEIEHVRNKSRAKDSGPWVTDTPEMQKKTIIRRLCKNLAIPPETPLGKAISRDLDGEQIDGEDLDLEIPVFVDADAPTVQGTVAQPPAAPPKTLADATKKLGGVPEALRPVWARLANGLLDCKTAEQTQAFMTGAAKADLELLQRDSKEMYGQFATLFATHLASLTENPAAVVPAPAPKKRRSTKGAEEHAEAFEAEAAKIREQNAGAGLLPGQCDACFVKDGHKPGCPNEPEQEASA